MRRALGRGVGFDAGHFSPNIYLNPVYPSGSLRVRRALRDAASAYEPRIASEQLAGPPDPSGARDPGVAASARLEGRMQIYVHTFPFALHWPRLLDLSRSLCGSCAVGGDPSGPTAGTPQTRTKVPVRE